MNARAPRSPLPPLTLARAIAWALLLGGWVGLGSLAIVLAPGAAGAFALVALWLLALGLAATVATRDTLRAATRRAALGLAALVTAAALYASTRGGGLPALGVALLAWAALTALASGVVRGLRLAQAASPAPPVGAAALGAFAAAVALADPADLQGLTLRLAAFVLLAAALLALLQRADGERSPASRCRAGLFDCSLPAWPSGAWNDLRQWPTLLAGLAMLPMMAALPLLAAWCSAAAIPPQAMVGLHFAAMFAPALLLRRALPQWSAAKLATVCALSLVAGTAAAIGAAAPWDMFGLALAHGLAWGLAWAGQLWAPERRGRQGASPLRAAIGYAGLTLAFGGVVAHFGAPGAAATHAALGGVAGAAWVYAVVAIRLARGTATPGCMPPVVRPDRPAGGG